MSKNKEVYTAVLLPWLKLGSDLQMGKYLFLVWPGNNNKFGKFTESLNSICGMYKYVDGTVETPQTIIIDDSQEYFTRIEGQERQAFQEAVTILTTALIGENEFFKAFGNYVNFSLTELHFQNFSIGEDWLAFTTYKRDGYTSDMGYKFHEITVSAPPGCRMRSGCGGLDQAWLDTLGIVLNQSTSQDRLIIEASNLFCQANTDSPNVLRTTEVVTLANAFDRLFPDSDGRYKLSKAISDELTTWITIRLRNSNRVADRQIVPSQVDSWCTEDWDIVQFWMLELYDLRNSYVHGNDITQRTWCWTPAEHLLMGAYVFPLLLKVLMSKEDRYELSEEDAYKLLAIDELLDVTEFYDRDTHRNAWRDKLNEVRLNTRLEEDKYGPLR